MAFVDINTAQYAEKITIEEYNKQKDEYTQKALKELQKQMIQQKVPKAKPISDVVMDARNAKYADDSIDISYDDDNNDDNDDNDDNNNDDDNSVIEYSDEEIANNQKQTNVNLIIKHVSMDNNSTKQNSKKKPIKDKLNLSDKQSLAACKEKSSINDVIYAQHEIDTHKIQTMKVIITKLKAQIDEESRKSHYLKLDLNNAQCDNDELKKQIIVLKAEYDMKTKEIEKIKHQYNSL